jgi:carboxyl-terminal processing protease
MIRLSTAWLLSLLLVGCARTASMAPEGQFIDAETARDTFEAAWTLVHETDVDPDHEGVDWNAVRERHEPAALACRTRACLREVIAAMLAELDRSHFGLLADDAPTRDDGAAAGQGSVGLDARWIGDRVIVTRVEPDSPAALAGVQVGWAIDTIDGVGMDTAPPEAAPGTLARYGQEMRAQAWTASEATAASEWNFLDANGAPQRRALQPRPPGGIPTRIGVLPTLHAECHDRWLTPEELAIVGVNPDVRIGLIRFNIWLPTIAAAIDDAVDRLRQADGIVIDLRGNPGGVGAMAMGVAGHFHDGEDSLGTMRTRDTQLEFRVNPRRSTADGRSVAPFTGPVAILVDPLTASTSEIFAAGLQSLGRAHVVGRTSAGAALPAQMRRLPSGDGILFAFADFTTPSGTAIEGRGVVPDTTSGATPESWRAPLDPDLHAAISWIERTRIMASPGG